MIIWLIKLLEASKKKGFFFEFEVKLKNKYPKIFFYFAAVTVFGLFIDKMLTSGEEDMFSVSGSI